MPKPIRDRLLERYTAINKRPEVKQWQTERAKVPMTAPTAKKK